MSLESVREFFRSKRLDIPIIELEVSTATVTGGTWIDVCE